MVAGLFHTRSKYNGVFTCESTLLLEYALAAYIPSPPFSLKAFLPSLHHHQSSRTTHLTATIKEQTTGLDFASVAYISSISIHSQRYVDDVTATLLPGRQESHDADTGAFF